MKVKKFLQSKYFIGSLLVVLLYVFFLIIGKITPFGENSIIKSDLYQQYINFLLYYKEVLLGNKSLLFSWNLGMGNNFFTTFAYYLVCPLNLLIVFFNKSNIYIFIEIIIFIKLLLIFIFSTLFFEKRFDYKKIDVIVFSLSYTFSSYVLSYHFNIMWLDALYMLPLILLFVEKYIKNNKIYPVVIAISLNIIMNYYMGLISLIFISFYYLIRSLIITDIKADYKSFFKKLFKFVFGIIIALGISMFLLLPSFMQVKGTMNFELDLISDELEYLLLFPNALFSNNSWFYTQKVGFLFNGTFVLILLPIYYLNRNIGKKEKILSSLFALFMLLPAVSPLINKFWHGMTEPNLFFFRYGFCLIFWIINMSFRAYQNKKYIKTSHIAISCLIMVILTIIELLLNKFVIPKYDFRVLSIYPIIISSIIYLLSIIVFSIKIEKTDKRLINALFIGLLVIDLSFSIINYHNTYEEIIYKQEEITKYDYVMDSFMSKVDNKESERVIFNPDKQSRCLSLKYGYSTIDCFTSARNRQTIKNMYALGYNAQRKSALFVESNNGTWFNYSMAGVHYYIEKNSDPHKEIYGFNLVDTIGEYNIYESDLALPFGYVLKDNVLIEESSDIYHEQSKNPFEIQNEILNNIRDDQYYYSLDNDCELAKVNLTETYKEGYKLLEYKIEALEDMEVYLFSNYELQLYLDDLAQYSQYASVKGRDAGIKHVVHINKGESYEFSITQDEEFFDKKIYVYGSSNEKIAETIKQAQTKTFDKLSIDKTKVEGKINSEGNELLVLQIPYDEGWSAKINGEPISIEKVYGTFIGINTKNGENNIELTYFPKYIKEGMLISLISLAILVFLTIFKK